MDFVIIGLKKCNSVITAIGNERLSLDVCAWLAASIVEVAVSAF